MERIVYDVPRWSIYLHRDARGLPPVDRDDSAQRRFEDELFERLFSGEVEATTNRDARMAAWAEKVHAVCDQLPDFARLAAECRGDALAAATAVEQLIAALPQQTLPDAPALRRAMRSGCERASAAVDEFREIIDGLGGVVFGPSPGTGSAAGQQMPNAAARSLASRIRDDPRLRQIALLAGRFKRICAAKRRSKVRYGADEIADIEQGADLGRLLPSELARLVHPTLRLAMLRDLTERRCLQYQLTGAETLGKGPLVVCLDKSGSMDGPPNIWATTVALALLDVAQKEHRPFALLGFDEGIKHEVVVSVGGALPAEALFVSCGGGTDISNVIERGLDIIENHPGALRKADIILITDGGSATDRAAELRARAVELGVSILGVGIGVSTTALLPWCDDAYAVVDLDRIDDKVAEALFAGR